MIPGHIAGLPLEELRDRAGEDREVDLAVFVNRGDADHRSAAAVAGEDDGPRTHA